VSLVIHETINGHSRIDFDKKQVRKAMRKFGAEIRKDARRRVSRKAISAPGDYPGRDSGNLFRSITSLVSKSGFMVRISPEKTAGMKEFYPAFLHYGVTGKSRRKDHREQPKEGKWRIAPRANYMTAALEARKDSIRTGLRNMLQDALIPR
jgi:hypothetical protein